MAKYSVTYSCGHTETRQLYGKETQRQSYIAWAGSAGRCAACAAQDKESGIEAAEAEHDLPSLTGSEKQIAWARSIRSNLITDLMAFLAPMQAKAEQIDQMADFERRVALVLQTVCAQTTARYWIDNKDMSVRVLIATAQKAAA